MSSQIASVLGDGLIEIGRRGPQRPTAPTGTRPSPRPAPGKDPLLKKMRGVVGLGCRNCPLNDVPGIQKVKNLDRIKGRKIMIWGISPIGIENAQGLEFCGPAGNWLWNELSRVGVKRSNCDVQNVCRCWPTTPDPITKRPIDRPPTKEELKACSLYTQTALERNGGKATVHLVFGQVTATTLLGREYKKNEPIFWSEKLQAKVCVLAHPVYFMRGGGGGRLKEWRLMLENAVDSVENVGRYAYLEKQDYRLVRTAAHARKVVRIATKAARKKNRVSVDIEYGWLDKYGNPSKVPGVGRQAILVIGLCWQPGSSRIFVIDHPEGHVPPKERKGIVAALDTLLSNPKVLKVMHHGTADATPIKELLDIEVEGYDFDTNYSTYLKWPQQQRYGLAEMAQTRVPEFAGYKEIITQHLNPDAVNYATIPLKVMRLYNGADCDLTKRLELLTQEKAGALLRTYKDVAFVLDEMQKNRGPFFDAAYYDEVVSLVPRRLATVRKELQDMAGNADMNLNSPIQVKEILYDKLKFVTPEGYPKFTTQAEVMRLFSQDKKRGAFPKGLIEYRELSKMEGTYLSNYRESAAINNGQLRTLWWLTGTITGRLRSGGKAKGQSGIVNFQNLHGEPMLQNLLISDPKWRRVLKASTSSKVFDIGQYKEHKRLIENLQLFLAFDYGQVEIRMAAEMSGDPNLIAAVEAGDIHSEVGHALTGWSREKIKTDKETRTLVKNLHFGVLFGMSKKSLYSFLCGLGIKISQSRCDELHDRYFRKYRKVRELIEHLQAFASKNGYVETLFGFRRPLNTTGDDDDRSTFWGNQAINSPIQGSAHQLMLFAMATLQQEPEKFPLLQVPVMEVHDALDFYTKAKDLPEALAEGLELFQNAVPRYIEKNFGRKLRVPLVAEGAAGFRLGVMRPYEGEKVREFIKGWLIKNSEVEKKITDKWGKAA